MWQNFKKPYDANLAVFAMSNKSVTFIVFAKVESTTAIPRAGILEGEGLARRKSQDRKGSHDPQHS
jgi:hypothetical protein